MKSKALCVLFVGALFFVANFSSAATANISGLVFTTAQQTIKPGDISKDITVQTQNSSGTAEKVDETNDTTFTSSSPSGQFLNSSSNPVSTTMSKNTSSRTFYYKDSTEGTYTLTVSIKGRDTGKTFSTTQQIVISSNTSTGTGDTGTETSTSTDPIATTTATSTDLTSTTTLSSDDGSSGSSVYSYSSGTPLSQFSEDDFNLKAYAGRDRVAFVNSPTKFSALIKTTNSTGNLSYTWSFGDGTSANSKEIEHYYVYPGIYNVVLNVFDGASSAVSSAKVEVLEPNVSISTSENSENNFVQISNNSNREINIEGYRILYGTKNFGIAQDTILSPNSSIKIPLQISGQEKISLTYPNGVNIADAISDTEKENKIADIKSQVLEIENKIAELNKNEIVVQAPEGQNLSQDEQVMVAEDERPTEVAKDESVQVEDGVNSATTTVTDPIAQTNQSFFDSLLSTPKKIFDFIKW